MFIMYLLLEDVVRATELNTSYESIHNIRLYRPMEPFYDLAPRFPMRSLQYWLEWQFDAEVMPVAPPQGTIFCLVFEC